MQIWCLGFIFNKSFDCVQLLRKGRTIHVGLWNGMGGKINPNESPIAAMTRECREEGGWFVHSDFWLTVGAIDLPNLPGKVHVFTTWVSTPFPCLDPFSVAAAADIPDDVPVGIPLEHVHDLPLAPHVIDLVDAAHKHFVNPTEAAYLTITDRGGEKRKR